MRLNRTGVRITVVGLAIALLIIVGWLWRLSPVSSFENSADAVRYWTARSGSVGAAQAYQEFEKMYASTPPSAHSIAHLFGHLIYGQLGDDGITVCDASFGYGCFHQFTTDAALHGGVSEIQKLADFCAAQATAERDACFHGLGHGLSEFFGPAHLSDALAQCAAFIPSEFSCDSGVFMDFNAPLIGGDSGLRPSPRLLDEAHPYEPCERLPARSDAAAEHACYGSLAQWWMLASPTITIHHIGELCEASPMADRIACYKGIGINLPGLENYDETHILEQCESIESDVGKRACEASSASVLHGFGKSYDALCARLGDQCLSALPNA